MEAMRASAISASSKSDRSEIDSQAAMGYGATRSLERVAAAMGETGPKRFLLP